MQKDKVHVAAPVAIPTTTGFVGSVVIKRGQAIDKYIDCPHNHRYYDTALHCAGVRYRKLRS